MTIKYPKTLAACKAEEQAQWGIGDALLAEIPVGDEGVRDDSRSKFIEVAAELKTNGFSYEPETLRHFRNVAYTFPAGSRLPAVSLACHQEAGNPQTLQAIIKNLPKGTKPTWMMIREVVQNVRRKAEDDRKTKLGQVDDRLAKIGERRNQTVAVLKSKADTAAKTAARATLRQIEEQQEATRQERLRYYRPVRRSDIEIEPEHVPMALASLNIDVLIGKARAALDEADRVSSEREGELTDVQRAYILKCARECLNIAKRIVARVQLSPTKAAGDHLHVVKG